MKSDIYEGGHHIPCLVQWPAMMKGGRQCAQPVSLNDFMATFAKITGYQLADNEAEDSYNLLALFKNPQYKTMVREAIVYHSINGSFSIRKGKWKLEMTPGSGGWSSPKPGKEEEGLPAVQLYDVEKDIAETNNVQAEHPGVVKELTALLKRYVQQEEARPVRRKKMMELFCKKG